MMEKEMDEMLMAYCCDQLQKCCCWWACSKWWVGGPYISTTALLFDWGALMFKCSISGTYCFMCLLLSISSLFSAFLMLINIRFPFVTGQGKSSYPQLESLGASCFFHIAVTYRAFPSELDLSQRCYHFVCSQMLLIKIIESWGCISRCHKLI